jgi:hypothetical protein
VKDAVLALPAYAREVVAWYTVIDELAADPAAGLARFEAASDRVRAFVRALA